ncbi:titin-like isoform X2 [Galleria mellonella]|uniref:Titin-like isoform X2 n=1 Tax=Galleria mellonella TaxID=7137 RepID=A0A6J3C5E9_GALME|nr:titin-like isoform X2 [Galleria mellonella]
MNDIRVTVGESLKDQAVVEVSPKTEQNSENEVDPLAIDDATVGTKDPLVDPITEEKSEKAGNVDICDDNAKEEKSSEINEENCTASNSEVVKEDVLKEDSNPQTSIVEENIQQTGPTHNEPEVVPEEAEMPPVQVEVPEPIVPDVKETIVPKAVTPEMQIKVPSPETEAPSEPKEEVKAPEKELVVTDVEMLEAPKEIPKPSQAKVTEEKVEKVESKPLPPVNGDLAKEEQATKRRSSQEIETESPLKRLCQEVEKTFPQHDTMINDYIQTATKNNIDEIQRHTEQLLSEIQTLRELAQKKEHEWNNILHLKKVKEEILLRLLRRKQVLSFEKSAEINGSDRTDPFDYLNQAKNLAIDKSDEISGLAIKQPGSTINPLLAQAQVMPVTSHFNPMAGLPPPYDKAAHMQSMPKPVFPQQMMMPGPMPGFPRDMNGQLPSSFSLPMGRQGPTKDVKSIIADYRQRNPDVTPRRGRRMKSILNPNMMNAPRPIAPKMDGMNNLNNLNMLFNSLDMNQKAMLERLQQMQAGGMPNGLSFKDVLVQFANMQQATTGLIPNRPVEMPRPDHHIRPEGAPRRRQERNHEEVHMPVKQAERLASPNPRLPPPPPYPEISLLPVTTSQETSQTQNSLLHGILTKASPATQSYSPTLAKLLTSPERKQSAPTLPTFGQAKNCGEITITPVQPAPPDPQPEKAEEVVQLDDEESATSSPSGPGSPSGSGSGRLVIDEGGEGHAEGGEGGAEGADGEDGAEAPLCQGCRRRDAQFVCAGCANQWYCSRDCQVAAWDEHSEMCSG